MRLYIETAATTDRSVRDMIIDDVRPPGNLKKQESIAAWWQNESEAAREVAFDKAALAPETGEIIAISAVSDSGHEFSRCRAIYQPEVDLIQQFYDVTESWLQAEAAKLPAIASAWPTDPLYPICHNSEFDLTYLWKRSKILRVQVPDWLPSPGARPGKYHGCTMVRWSGPQGRISLDRLCRLLGIESPKNGSIDGASVGAAWQAGRTEHIQQYNLRDARAVQAIWERLA